MSKPESDDVGVSLASISKMVAKYSPLKMLADEAYEKGRRHCEAELAACEAALASAEARVGDLVEVLKKADQALHDDGCRGSMWPRPQIAAAIKGAKYSEQRAAHAAALGLPPKRFPQQGDGA